MIFDDAIFCLQDEIITTTANLGTILKFYVTKTTSTFKDTLKYGSSWIMRILY